MTTEEKKYFKGKLPSTGRDVELEHNPVTGVNVLYNYAPGRCLVFRDQEFDGVKSAEDLQKIGKKPMACIIQQSMLEVLTPEEILEQSFTKYGEVA